MNIFLLLDRIERPVRWLYCELIYGPWVYWQLRREWAKQMKQERNREH